MQMVFISTPLPLPDPAPPKDFGSLKQFLSHTDDHSKPTGDLANIHPALSNLADVLSNHMVESCAMSYRNVLIYGEADFNQHTTYSAHASSGSTTQPMVNCRRALCGIKLFEDSSICEVTKNVTLTKPAHPYKKAVSKIGTHIGLSSITHGRPATPDTSSCAIFTAFGISLDPVPGLENTLGSYLMDAVLNLENDTSLTGLIAPSALVQACNTGVNSHHLPQLPASVNVDHCCWEPSSKKVPCLALLGGEISTPHLPWLFFLSADDVRPKKLHALYSLAPIDVMTAYDAFT